MDYFKSWFLLKNSILAAMKAEEEYSTKKDVLQSVLNDMASIETGIVFEGE